MPVQIKLTQDAFQIHGPACIDVDERPDAERAMGSQPSKGGSDLILVSVSIQMPVMAFALREALGCYLGRTDTVDFDDLSRQRR